MSQQAVFAVVVTMIFGGVLSSFEVNAIAGQEPSQNIKVVETTKARFEVIPEGIIRANGRIIWERSHGGQWDQVSTQMLSAVGEVLSVLVEEDTCEATCETFAGYLAINMDGELVPLDQLAEPGEILRALKRQPEVLAVIRRAGGDEAVNNFQSHQDLSGAIDSLNELLGAQERDNYMSRELIHFAISGYDANLNRLTVVTHFNQLISDDNYMDTAFSLTLTPRPEFQVDLEGALQGRGLFLGL